MSVGDVLTVIASYRKWRTERKVTAIVSLTWIIPMAVFFTSIFGWQHFVGYRSVPPGKCYVQYMEDALFNCLLQVSRRIAHHSHTHPCDGCSFLLGSWVDQGHKSFRQKLPPGKKDGASITLK